MSDIFIDMSYICAYESFMADTDMLTMDPASEAFGVSIKKFFSNIRAAIKAIIAKIRQRIRAVVDRLKTGAGTVAAAGIKKALTIAHPEDFGEKRAPSKPKNYDAYLRNAFAVMVDLEKIINSHEFVATVGSWMAQSWNIDETESYLKSIKSELEDLTDRANATAEMCTPEIRAYLGNFDLNARTKFASSYKRIDDIIRGLEREVDAEVARCEKEADDWSAMARDDLSHGRTSSSQFSDETAQKYKKEAMEARKRAQRALTAMQSLLHAVNACSNALFTKM